MTEPSREHLLIFHVGQWRFGIRMPLVKQVQTADSRWLDTESTADPVALLLDDGSLPVYRLHPFLGTTPLGGENRVPKVLVVNHPDRAFGLLADRVDGVIAVDPHRISPLPPALGASARECFSDVINQEGNPVLMIQPGGLADQCRRLAEAHRRDRATGSRPRPELSDNAVTTPKPPAAASETPAGDGLPHIGHLPAARDTDRIGTAAAAAGPTDGPMTENDPVAPVSDSAVQPEYRALLDEDRMEKILCHAIETIAQQKMERLFARAVVMSRGRL